MGIIDQAKKAIEEAKNKPIVWEVRFFDIDQAERIEWVEKESAELAEEEVKKQWKGAKPYHVKKSKYTMEEIEGLS